MVNIQKCYLLKRLYQPLHLPFLLAFIPMIISDGYEIDVCVRRSLILWKPIAASSQSHRCIWPRFRHRWGILLVCTSLIDSTVPKSRPYDLETAHVSEFKPRTLMLFFRTKLTLKSRLCSVSKYKYTKIIKITDK